MIAGVLAASTGVGIAVGCVIAGVLSKNRVRGGIVRLGAWGLTLSLLALALPGPGWNEVREEIRTLRLGSPASIHEQSQGKSEDRTLGELTTVEQVGSREATPQTPRNPAEIQRDYFRGTMLGPWGSALALISVGLFAGFYSVPLQVYLQSKAPSEQKGRIIGANNLVNWIGIASAGGVCFLGRIVLVDWLLLPYASLFGLAAALMLPVALFYRPPNVRIESTPE
jgi:acyl-[acyl-carrier-protein]-phospholipid O-acyltransferase/long-chain-fatty-acid--[acyl-carrier-protein] ligase